MFYIPKDQISLAKDLIYPVNRGLNPAWHKNNLQVIKESQEKNRLKREEEDKYVPPELYKLQQFKNVSSNLYSHTKEWVAKEALKHKSPPPIEKEIKSKKKCETIRQLNYALYNQKNNESLFEKYYADRIKTLKKLNEHSLSANNINSNPNNNLNVNSRQLTGNKGNKQDTLLVKTTEGKPNEEPRVVNILTKTILPNEDNKQSVELPKINHNYIQENRQLVIHNQVPKKYTVPPEPESAIHRDYGKMPEYLEKYKQEEEKKREYLKQLEEESKYPKGTKLLKEEERLQTLMSLIDSKIAITNIVERMPITKRSFSVQKRKDDLEKKLEEIDNAIITFSKQKVFVKCDN